MTWDPEKVLLQLQADQEFADRLAQLAKEDRLSRSSEIRKLLELGIQARTRLLETLGANSLNDVDRAALNFIDGRR